MIKKFLNSKAFIWWLLANAAFPFFYDLTTAALPFEMRMYMGWAAIILVLAANIWLATQHLGFRAIFFWTIGLNLLFTVLVGSITLVDGLWSLPVMISALMG